MKTAYLLIILFIHKIITQFIKLSQIRTQSDQTLDIYNYYHDW